MRDQLVNETIDGRILRLLGLEDVFDLDYETYLVLLREAQVRGKNTLPAEEQAIIANERKRVRGKTGRFKPKTKKIKVENVTSVKTIGQRLLPARQQGGQLSMPLVKSLETIGKTVESISDNLSDQSKSDQKAAEDERKAEENKRRQAREEKLELGVKKVVSAAKKLFSPVQNIFDKLFNYLFYTFLGKGVITALDWLSNPANKEKVSALGKFVKDFWPALLGAAAYFFTPLGKFIRTTIGLVRNLGKFFFKGPKSLDPVSLGVGAAVSTFEAERRKQQEEKRLTEEEAKKRGVKSEIVQGELKESKKSWWSMFGQGFSDVGLAVGGISGGGFIDQNTGLKITGAGPDTQLTALMPGEVVMNRAAVQAIGADKLLALNKLYGGPNANKPTYANNIRLAQGGGFIGSIGEFLSRGTGRVMAPTGGDLGFQRKFMGINIGRRERLPLSKTYTKESAERYNKLRAQQGARDYLDLDMFGRHISMTRSPTASAAPSAAKPKPKGTKFERGLVNLVERGYLGKGKGGRVEQMEEILGRKLGTMSQKEANEYMMKEFGRSTVGEQRKLLLGPQSRALPPSPPTGRGGFNVINLPPVTQQVAAASPMQKAVGTEVPTFSAVAPGNRRMDNAAVYGLVG